MGHGSCIVCLQKTIFCTDKYMYFENIFIRSYIYIQRFLIVTSASSMCFANFKCDDIIYIAMFNLQFI